MTPFHRLSIAVLISLVSNCVVGEEKLTPEIQFFESSIRPLLLKSCADCHGEETQEGGLRLDSPSFILQGGDSGPLINKQNPERSLLLSAVSHQDETLAMPPDEKLSPRSIESLRQWVKMGSPLPDVAAIAWNQSPQKDLSEARQHWSFQPIRKSDTGELSSEVNPIDHFIQTQRTQRQLTGMPRANKRTLIRRAYLDLIGLPPTREQVHLFLEDDSPDAFSKVVEELLASPHYGERWGRHWLDIARYADSNGLDENVAHGNAWRYRDYVIAAFNSDRPFDDFIREQLAGDLLGKESGPSHEQLIATGFLSLGPKVLAEGDQTKMQMDIIDEQIDTTGRVFLGLTFGCARCHDHKFDPISTADYYALAGIFQSTKTMESLKRIAKWNENVIASAEQIKQKEQHDRLIAATEKEIEELKQKLKGANSTVSVDATGEKQANEIAPSEQLKQLEEKLKSLKESTPELPTAMGVVDGEPVDAAIHIRGSHLSLGNKVNRRFPEVLVNSDSQSINRQQSGRLELANWLASKENPLVARVWVNRVWRWHFGRGLVSTVDNFGLLGEEPTHPELLDWLANSFIENGWSTKELHRLILNSATYQQSSEFHAGNHAIDPENQFLWRFNKQRMSAEIYRDSLLSVSGRLDKTMGGSLLHVKNREFIFNHTSKDETNYDSLKRSVYLPVIRNNLYVGFSLFDYTDASVPNGDRATSTVAPQALYALNSPLIITSAESFASKIVEQHSEAESRLKVLFETCYSRLPTEGEMSAAEKFINSFADQTEREVSDEQVDSENNIAAWTALCQAFLISNEFIYVE